MVSRIIASKSSAQMVSLGQMQEARFLHPSDHRVSATISVGILAPKGYGAQRVMMQAKTAISEKTKIPCHHLAFGKTLAWLPNLLFSMSRKS
jgi:hypothetical protein